MSTPKLQDAKKKAERQIAAIEETCDFLDARMKEIDDRVTDIDNQISVLRGKRQGLRWEYLRLRDSRSVIGKELCALTGPIMVDLGE